MKREIIPQEKWRSKYFWVGIGGVAVSLVVQLGLIDFGQGEQINAVISAIAGALGAFGVWNDAGNKEEW